MIKIRRIKAKRPFIPTSIPGASYVINQYVGCQHACKYCYAKYMGKWYGYEKWGSWIIIKENMAEIVKGKYVEGKVYMRVALAMLINQLRRDLSLQEMFYKIWIKALD